MADYIRRDDALFALRKAERGGSMTALTRLERAYAEIREMPAADVAEVVRCRGCKYYRNHPNGLCYLHTEPTENERGYSGEAVCVEPDDFCSYGERREE